MQKKINRRDFCKISTLGAVGLTIAGCRPEPVEKMLPFSAPPYSYTPGVPIHFATTCRVCSAGCGMVIRTREGRAVKAEGNPHHPFNRGSLCPRGQAALQELYSPSRAAGPTISENGSRRRVTWEEGKKRLSERLLALSEKSSGRILYLGPPRTGVFPEMIAQWIEGMGGGTYFAFDMAPVNSLKKANEITFGREEIPHYNIREAELLLNFGSDFLETWLNPVQLSRNYSHMHGFHNGKKGKYIHCSPHLSMSGVNADEWIPCRTGTEAMLALALCRLLLESADHVPPAEKTRLTSFLKKFSIGETAGRSGVSAETLKSVAGEFSRNGGSLAIAGGNCNAGLNATHLQIAVNLMNYLAGNIGRTVVFGADHKIGGNSMADLGRVIDEMHNGRYDLVMIENVNPVYCLPESSGFKEALDAVPFVASLSTEADETSGHANLHLPVSHFLESWGDAHPCEGIYSLQQPVMAKVPAFDTMALEDLLLELARIIGLQGFSHENYRDYLEMSWKTIHQKSDCSLSYALFWEQSLQKGGYFRKFEPEKISSLSEALFTVEPEVPESAGIGYSLLPVNSSLHDAGGRGGNKSWLVETPHPVTQVVWDAWLEIHPETAWKNGIRHGDLVEVSNRFGKVEVAAYVFYGLEKETVAIPAGLGRDVLFPNYESRGDRSVFSPVLESKAALEVKPIQVGVNVMELVSWQLDPLSGDLALAGEKVQIKPTGKSASLVAMDGQFHSDLAVPDAGRRFAGLGERSQKGRKLIQTIAYGRHGGLAGDIDGIPESGMDYKPRHYTLPRENKRSFYDPMAENVKAHAEMSGKETPEYYEPYKWEMVIDLDRCTGCSACVVACYAENNIPVVGKERMALGREMSWIRIERYFEVNTATNRLETYFSPQMCQQCNNAGCEPVCPVYATYHTPDGLNAMIYNRCVGTRYCSNNCPFKQRRFNWRDYRFPKPLHLQLNPDVSVRTKGIMEKCTFCQHRIREMKDMAKDRGRDVVNGEIKTACQQVCPTDAISFGNIRDENSRVRRLKSTSKRAYIQLPELNYQPAVTYLKKVNHGSQKA